MKSLDHRLRSVSVLLERGETTQRRAAASVGLTRTQLLTRLRKSGLTTCAAPGVAVWRSRKITKEGVIKAQNLLMTGMLWKDVARRVGTDPNNLHGLMDRYGIPHASRHRPDSPVRLKASRTDRAYFAGIFDGEGSLSAPRLGHTTWQICIANTDKGLIDWVSEWGGFRYVREPSKKGSLGRKTQYVWLLNRSIDVARLLNVLLPFLRVKRDRALQALEYFRSRGTLKNQNRSIRSK